MKRSVTFIANTKNMFERYCEMLLFSGINFILVMHEDSQKLDVYLGLKIF